MECDLELNLQKLIVRYPVILENEEDKLEANKANHFRQVEENVVIGEGSGTRVANYYEWMFNQIEMIGI